jgi:hypothetical protein
VDVAVKVADDAEAEGVVFELRAAGYDLISLVEQKATRRLATARLHLPSTGKRNPIVDVLFASTGIEPEIAESATAITVLPELTIRVACPGHLVAMKVLARNDRTRPQDFDDLMALLAIAKAADLDDARVAVRLIESRGCSRGRDLIGDLERVIAESGR